MIGLYWFVKYNKCSMPDVMSGGSCMCVMGLEVGCGNSLLRAQFFYKPKMALKNNVLSKAKQKNNFPRSLDQ